MIRTAQRSFNMGPKNAYPQPTREQLQAQADAYRLARHEKRPQVPSQILTSSSYQERPPLPTARSDPGAPQFFGGFVNDDPSLAGQGSSRRAIRSIETPEFESSSSTPQPSGRKQRGRPRLDPQDETPADRRRTQIRLAQRAYRNRKETTISELRGQVTDMQRNIEQMSKTFAQLHDNLYDSGVLNRVPANHPIIQQLDQMMDSFAEAARVSVESDRESQERGSQVDVEHAKLAALRLGESDESSTDPEAWPQTIPEV